MTWNVYVKDQAIPDRVTCAGISISPDGALVCVDSAGSAAKIYNASHWLKAEPAAIQGSLS